LPVGTALGDNLHGADFTTTNRDAAYDLAELNREQTFGGIGTTKARDVPRIDLIGFDRARPRSRISFGGHRRRSGFSSSSITGFRKNRSTKPSP
jgi:hypothetical protein